MSFNLALDPWIPVVDNHGGKRLVSLRAAFAEGRDIRDLAVNPAQRVALTRLLVCVAQAALDGPEDGQQWLECQDKIAPAADQYLAQWQDKFNLYGEHPFMQAAKLKETNNASIDKLDFGLAAGNNATLFDHAASPDGRTWEPAWIALQLLTYQNLSPGGLIGITKWDGVDTTKTSEHAPAIEGSAMHTIVRGGFLTETIWLNLLSKRQVSSLPGMEFGQPLWELDALPSSSSKATGSYLGRLVPLSRAIRLASGKNTFSLANGYSYPKIPAQRETMATVVRRVKGKEEYESYVAVNLDRHPWRELSSVASLGAGGMAGGAPAVSHLTRLPSGQCVDIWTGGMAADKGKILDMAEWVFSLPVSLLGDSPLKNYQAGVELAQNGENVLRNAIKKFYAELHVEPVPYGVAKTHFWSHLDQRYGVLVEAACEGAEQVGELWRPIVDKAMRAAFERACPRSTPRQIQAYAKARETLKLRSPKHAS